MSLWLAFSKLVFSWLMLFVGAVVCSPWVYLRVILFLLSNYFSIKHFLYVLSVYIFYSEIILFFFLAAVDFSHQLVGRILFRSFCMSCFFYIVWSCPCTLLIFFLSLISFDLFLLVVLSDLSAAGFCGSLISFDFLYV